MLGQVIFDLDKKNKKKHAFLVSLGMLNRKLEKAQKTWKD